MLKTFRHVAAVMVEFRSRHLQNTNQNRYRYSEFDWLKTIFKCNSHKYSVAL
jgi:hypothetical protein